MSQATDYALRLTRSAGFAWFDFVRDVRDGAFATARLVVTLAGCTALLAVAAVASNEEARGQLAEFMPRNLPFVSAPEAGPVEQAERIDCSAASASDHGRSASEVRRAVPGTPISGRRRSGADAGRECLRDRAGEATRSPC